MQPADNFALTAPHTGAIYLPAVTSGYIDASRDGQAPLREFPDSFDLADLAFWTGNSKIFNHTFCLHSIGSQKVGSNFNNALFQRSRGEYMVVGDSGGYQIGRGTLEGLKGLKQGQSGDLAVRAWRYENFEVRDWIVRSLNNFFDYSMTIDMALWINTQHGENSPFHHCNDEQLIAMTVDNLRFVKEYGLGRTKWLNVLQGTTAANMLAWWNAVKDFREGGWALASGTGWRGGIYNMLTMLLIMRDENAFAAGQDWLHMLGVSQPVWDLFFTACQNKLRQTANPKLQFSYDSSTPFMVSGKLDKIALVPELTSDFKTWQIRSKKIDAVFANTKSDEPAFPQNTSPLGSLFSMRHLVVRNDKFEDRRIDNTTNHIIANHNIWVYLDASRRVHDITFGQNKDRSRIPLAIRTALEIIEQAFDESDWRTFLNANKSMLDSVAASQDI